jgi:hypothetical protein
MMPIGLAGLAYAARRNDMGFGRTARFSEAIFRTLINMGFTLPGFDGMDMFEGVLTPLSPISVTSRPEPPPISILLGSGPEPPSALEPSPWGYDAPWACGSWRCGARAPFAQFERGGALKPRAR